MFAVAMFLALAQPYAPGDEARVDDGGCESADCVPAAEAVAEAADGASDADARKRDAIDNVYGVDRLGRSKYNAADALDDLIELEGAYEPCVLAAAEGLARSSNETAAVIADAALGQCARIEEAWRRAANRVIPGDATPRIIMLSEDRRASSRLKAIALVISLRR